MTKVASDNSRAKSTSSAYSPRLFWERSRAVGRACCTVFRIVAMVDASRRATRGAGSGTRQRLSRSGTTAPTTWPTTTGTRKAASRLGC